VKAGDSRAFLTVGTYPVQNALSVVAKGTGNGAVGLHLSGGGVALFRPRHPTNVYAAFPGSNYQVEVYSPTARLARRLVLAGKLSALGSSSFSATATGPQAASPASIRALAATLGQPIYWAGAKQSVTYELTRSPEGRIYVRYLPRGVAIGSSKPYLTVGTYPVRSAFQATKKAARAAGTIPVSAGGGAVAMFTRKHPTNVYVAYPGVDFQVEVYSPKPGEARRLVTAQSIIPVR
jgi:hypothetical protein